MSASSADSFTGAVYPLAFPIVQQQSIICKIKSGNNHKKENNQLIKQREIKKKINQSNNEK
jgi:hypothetical protein